MDLTLPLAESNLDLWLRSRPAVFCNLDTPEGRADFRWTRRVTTAQVNTRARRFRVTGPVTRLQVTERTPSGRVSVLEVASATKTITLRTESMIRSLLGSLPSVLFVIEPTDAGFTIYGGGYGHGVGMCQEGAMGMARRGYDAKAILSHYYPGARLVYVMSTVTRLTQARFGPTPTPNVQ